MKILHVVAGDLQGGAAKGALWLHQAQRRIGLESHIISNGSGEITEAGVTNIGTTFLSRLRFRISHLLRTLPIRLYWRRERRIFNTGAEGIDITRTGEYEAADIIHLHWINGLLNLKTLQKIRKPIVWTLRDMWPMTGGCHYAMECTRYISGCGKCPQLGSRHDTDLSRLVIKRKILAIPKSTQLVGISEWISTCAQDSLVFKGFPIRTIPNAIDTESFTPVDRQDLRTKLGLPACKKLVLVGAQSLGDFYKGFDLFLDAAKHLDKEEVHVVFFGHLSAALVEDFALDFSNLGFINKTETLRDIYSAADVFVAPSRMEAFGKTLAESLACGTPVVCFDATGPRDIVSHMLTGYRATAFDSADLAKGIKWVLDHTNAQTLELRRACRSHAENLFSFEVIAKEYQDMYMAMLTATASEMKTPDSVRDHAAR